MITVSSLSKRYDKRGIAGLHQISLRILEGKIFALMGPNGSGKTTLLNVLSGVLPEDSGSFTIDGTIARFPLKFEISGANVQDFLRQSISLEIDEDKKIQLTRDIADTFEFTFQLRQNLEELSSGQLQKVLLARELINRPAVLMMDEPFTHLDPFTRGDILRALFDYIRNQGLTVLWVTHDLEEALHFSDEVAVMNFGKIEQSGSPMELMRNPSNLFVAQFMGYRNFFPVKLEGDKWKTPFGEFSHPKLPQEDAILIVPDRSWRIDPQGMNCRVLEVRASRQAVEFLLEHDQQKLWFSAPANTRQSSSDTLSLLPVLKECLLIPL